jgi:hypothetical protein
MTRLSEPNLIEARELALYAVNEGDLYRGQTQAILANLRRKIAKGVYDAEKAIVLWGYLADAAAKKYRAEFGPMIGGFNKATRIAAAREIAEHYAEELRT